jgi:hypothetical protein
MVGKMKWNIMVFIPNLSPFYPPYKFGYHYGGQNGIEYHGVYTKFVAILPTRQSSNVPKNVI